MTKEERHLWYDFLRLLPITVNRQKVIGNYIVDFYIASCKIVIELDGSQHYEDKGIEKDAVRDKYLESLGIKVLRYSNYDVNLKFRNVCEDILKNIDECPNTTSSVTTCQLPLSRQRQPIALAVLSGRFAMGVVCQIINLDNAPRGSLNKVTILEKLL